ncbi:MAG: hypothetical protein GY874_14635 [Desulfobacteraceae bacterium]|nr:hypothetical protein [Desulfobacteraceae bacterium]
MITVSQPRLITKVKSRSYRQLWQWYCYMAATARQTYYPTPVPNEDIYSGSATQVDGCGIRGACYAWEEIIPCTSF